MATSRLQHNYNTFASPLPLFYQNKSYLYYSMRPASNQPVRTAQGTRDNHQDTTKSDDMMGQVGYEVVQSKNFMKIDDGRAYKKSKKKATCTSPTSVPGSKRLKGDRTYVNGSAIDEDESARVVKNSNRKQGQNPLQSINYLNEHHSNPKNKQPKDATRTINTTRPVPYKKTDALSTDRLRKYKQMLSPSRNNKNKTSSTHSKKLLRSTQETFTIVSKNAAKHQNTIAKSPTKVVIKKEPQEYLLLDDHFLSINHDEADLLEQKISFNQCIRQSFPRYLLKAYHQLSMDEEEEESFPTDKTFEKSQASSDSIQKVVLIQRWWRSVLRKKTCSFNPIIFDRNKRQLFEQESKGHQRCKKQELVPKKDEMCHLQFLQSNSSNVSMINSKQRTRSLNPLGLRQELARQQERVYKELLDKLFKLGKITPQTYKEKNEAIQIKFQRQMQKISDIKRLLSQNTRAVHEMTQKIKEDCEKIDNMEGQLSKSFLDSIFGSNSENSKQNVSIECMQAHPQTVINRQKSKGCHYQGKEEAFSFYSKQGKTLQQQYAQDFQQNQIQPSQIQHSEQAQNTNFGQILEQYKKQQQAAMQIDQRAAIQMGMFIPDLPGSQSVGIDSSLNGIHSFLISFFKFYICFYKEEFLRLINMPYGYDVNRRIKFLQGYDVQDYYPEEDDDGIIYGLEDLIHEDILEQYYARMQTASKDPQSTARRANNQFEKMHNRAVFDCFNAALNQFRPYFQINGSPYPWNYSEKALTFYCIADENIQQVFQKTQFKVLKWATSLCGIIVQKFANPCLLITPQTSIQDSLDLYKNCTNPSLYKAREERFNREVKAQISEPNNGSWGMYEDQLTLLYLQCSEYAVGKAIQEFVLELGLYGLLGMPLLPSEPFKECGFQ